MKRLLLIVLACIITTNIVAQTKNYQWLLAEALSNDDFLMVRKYKNLCGDTIDASLNVFYHYKMYGYLNKPDSSAIYLEKALKEYPDLFSIPQTKFAYINILIELWHNLENYERLIGAYSMAEELTTSTNADEDWARQQLAFLKKLRKEAQEKMKMPKMSVKNISDNPQVTIPFTEEPVVTTNVKVNGTDCKTWLDTGGGVHLIMTKEIAGNCHVNKRLSQKDSLEVNGKRIRADWVRVDSIQIGSILFTQVPAIVVQGKFSSFVSGNVLTEKEQNEYESILNTVGMIVGLPLLKKLGSMEFDWDKKIINLSLLSEISTICKANLFTLNNQLFTYLKVNTADFVGMIDNGSVNAFIELSKPFFEKERDKFLLNDVSEEKTVYQKSIGVLLPTKRRTVGSAELLWENRSVEAGPDDVVVLDKDFLGAKDGMIGYKFIKSLGSKVAFDFVNMRLSVE